MKLYLARVVQKVDNAIHRIARFVLLKLIYWIAIYPVDSVIQPFNNLVLKKWHLDFEWSFQTIDGENQVKTKQML